MPYFPNNLLAEMEKAGVDSITLSIAALRNMPTFGVTEAVSQQIIKAAAIRPVTPEDSPTPPKKGNETSDQTPPPPTAETEPPAPVTEGESTSDDLQKTTKKRTKASKSAK